MTAAAIIPPNRRADGTARSHRNDQQEKPEVTDTGTYIGRVVPIEWVLDFAVSAKTIPAENPTAHQVPCSNAKILFQSFFMLMTVQFFFLASS